LPLPPDRITPNGTKGSGAPSGLNVRRGVPVEHPRCRPSRAGAWPKLCFSGAFARLALDAGL
jgi:hypothetical protein